MPRAKAKALWRRKPSPWAKFAGSLYGPRRWYVTLSPTDFRPEHLGAWCCTRGLEGSGGERQLGSSFVREGAAPECQSRLGGLESAGSLWDGIPGGILSFSSLGRLGLEVDGGLRVVG